MAHHLNFHHAIVGRLVDIDDKGLLRDRPNHILAWDSSGKISHVEPYDSKSIPSNSSISHLPNDGFLVPGAIDCHIHYPQTRIIGGLGKDLLDWLDLHVWPEESRFQDAEYAQEVAKQFYTNLISSGTTSSMAFGSQFKTAMDEFFSIADQLSMTMCSGLVAQDRNTLPAVEFTVKDFSTQASSLAKDWHNKNRIRYTILPRFSIACSEEMLEFLGDFLNSSDYYMQTHINESINEIETVAQLFPNHKDYLDTYDAFNLLGPKSSFAHSIHTTESEMLRMHESGSKAVHCPSSNGFLGSGAFPYKAHENKDILIGVGTDVGAGLSFSMWKEMGHAHLMQMRLQPELRQIWTGTNILKAITRDGAAFLNLENEIGSLDKSKWADLAFIQPKENSYLTLQRESNQRLTLDQFLFRLATAHESDFIAQTWIAGKSVFHRDTKETHPSLR